MKLNRQIIILLLVYAYLLFFLLGCDDSKNESNNENEQTYEEKSFEDFKSVMNLLDKSNELFKKIRCIETQSNSIKIISQNISKSNLIKETTVKSSGVINIEDNYGRKINLRLTDPDSLNRDSSINFKSNLNNLLSEVENKLKYSSNTPKLRCIIFDHLDDSQRPKLLKKTLESYGISVNIVKIEDPQVLKNMRKDYNIWYWQSHGSPSGCLELASFKKELWYDYYKRINSNTSGLEFEINDKYARFILHKEFFKNEFHVDPAMNAIFIASACFTYRDNFFRKVFTNNGWKYFIGYREAVKLCGDTTCTGDYYTPIFSRPVFVYGYGHASIREDYFFELWLKYKESIENAIKEANDRDFNCIAGSPGCPPMIYYKSPINIKYEIVANSYYSFNNTNQQNKFFQINGNTESRELTVEIVKDMSCGSVTGKIYDNVISLIIKPEKNCTGKQEIGIKVSDGLNESDVKFITLNFPSDDEENTADPDDNDIVPVYDIEIQDNKINTNNYSVSISEVNNYRDDLKIAWIDLDKISSQKDKFELEIKLWSKYDIEIDLGDIDENEKAISIRTDEDKRDLNISAGSISNKWCFEIEVNDDGFAYVDFDVKTEEGKWLKNIADIEFRIVKR